MAGGHSVDPEVLAGAARDVKEYPADQLANPLSAVEEVALAAADFGSAAGHQEKYAAFKAGIDTVVTSVRSYIAASENYAANLTAGGVSYAASDQQSAEDVHDAGSM